VLLWSQILQRLLQLSLVVAGAWQRVLVLVLVLLLLLLLLLVQQWPEPSPSSHLLPTELCVAGTAPHSSPHVQCPVLLLPCA
jgi:hypothetical protein